MGFEALKEWLTTFRYQRFLLWYVRKTNRREKNFGIPFNASRIIAGELCTVWERTRLLKVYYDGGRQTMAIHLDTRTGIRQAKQEIRTLLKNESRTLRLPPLSDL